MNIFLFLFIFLSFLLQAKCLAHENCFRFCVIHLSTLYYRFNNNLLDLKPQYCSHLILDAYEENELNYDLLLKAFKSLQNSRIFLIETKILTLLKSKELIINETNTQFFKTLNNFDGFYFNWREEKYISENFYTAETIKEKQIFLSNILSNYRRLFKNKIIVTTVGPKYAFREYYNFQIFSETIDFIVLDTEQYLMYMHEQNWFPSKQRLSNNNATMEKLANILTKNGISKNKLLIYVDGPNYVEEPRIRMIWSSLNNFSGVLIDNIQKFNNKLFKPNKMNDDIAKLEKLQVCFSDLLKKNVQSLSCYYSINDDDKSYLKISKEKFQKCKRIILHKISSNYSSNEISAMKNVIQYFQSLNLTNTSLILSFEINYNDTRKIWKDIDNFEIFSDIIASTVKELVQNFGLDGIELISDDSMTAENWQKIIFKIKSKLSKKIEIGLQVNVFKASELVEVMNNLTWVTHKYNPLSDAALAIFYQWNDLYEKYEMDLQKVIIKFSPGIWQQNAIFSFPGKAETKEKENPEDDVILNRKYLCLNETIRRNLPNQNSYLNLPIIFSIQDDTEKLKEKMLQNLRDPNLAMAVLSYHGFGKSLPQDRYYLRQEDGIDADWYPGYELAGPCNTSQLKLAQLQSYQSQTPQSTLNFVYPNIKVISEKDAIQRRKEFQKSPTIKNIKEVFLANIWLHVKMPSSFNYTGAIMLNRPRQGLLHTILRHYDEWGKIIANFQAQLNSSLQNQINSIGAAKNPKIADALIYKFFAIFYALDDSSLITLQELQMDIYNYIQNNVTSASYQGEGCNEAGKQQVYWKIKDLKENDLIMVTCVSTELFAANPDFQDKRLIRTITTVFTMSMKDFNNRLIVKLF